MAVLGGVALVLALLLVAIGSSIEIALFADGIHRRARRRVLLWRSDTGFFTKWDEIAEVVPTEDVVVSTWVSSRNPVIILKLYPTIPPRPTPRWGPVDQIRVSAYTLASEPNALLAVLRFLTENPDQRGRIAGPEAESLLTPPPLRERFQLSRAVDKRSGGHV
ncbi:hypothetical protein [Speluncibacter jeojiensis]|uniref:Uncharacterized protein n=1 Tax=Speluncibacter jeojiensis TaxID=2710754 RepID=A0A9X4M5A4_9ACTN|nr:hypothetical protein [Corynebacteriales bacterium D3-21]